MALYDNKHWLLSHIRNSFISTDDTGMCELVMVGEDIPKQLALKPEYGCFLPIDESDEDDDMDSYESLDIQLDMDYGIHRLRSNTAQRIEKLDIAFKKAAKVKHIKWEDPPELTKDDLKEIFVRRDYKNEPVCTNSLLTQQLKNYTNLPHNPYLEYAKFDGSCQLSMTVRKYNIFLTMLPEEERNYPMSVCVLASAKVQDLIGLICLKFSTNHGDYPLKPVTSYGLYITEDDGEVDWDFPCLDPRESVAKFGFNCLGLVEHKNSRNVSFESTEIPLRKQKSEEKEDLISEQKISQQDDENMARMKIHTTAMEAPLYQCYKVYLVHKIRVKTEIQLGVSGDKIEIDPVQQKNSKFWVRQKPVSYSMDSIAWCEIIETRSSRAIFRLVYSLSHSALNHTGLERAGSTSNHPLLHSSASFKHHDFEAQAETAEEIVQKINLILELRSSISRKEYLATREKKSTRRRSFHLGSKS